MVKSGYPYLIGSYFSPYEEKPNLGKQKINFFLQKKKA
jgi:hypothetical protein